MKKTAATIILGAFLLNVAFAQADFNPSALVSDDKFTDTQAFSGATGIQQFLQNKNSVLANTSPDFLLQLKEPQDSNVKNGLGDPEPNLGRLRTAAELIWDASQKNGINPQVIIVTLQKEQSLITRTFSNPSALQTALNHALGFNCTDSAGCDQTFSGFYYQLFGNFDAQGNRYIGAPASLMRSYNTTNGRGPGVDANNTTYGQPIIRTSRVGDTISLDNTQGPPNNAVPTQTVTLSNLATAALYRYTPHVYNGNYNFWKFFTTWFKYQNGTLLKVTGGANIYIIENGAKSLLANFVMLSRGINPVTANIVNISQSDFDSYDTGPVLAPPDDTIVTMNADPNHSYYVFEQGIKHPVSSFVLGQRKLNINNAFSISQQEADLFTSGSLLTPAEGTLIQGDQSKIVYVIKNQQKYALTAFTFAQYKYSFKNVVKLPQSEVNLYDNAGFLLPKDGTLIKFASSPEVFELQNEFLHPISSTVFKLSKFSFSNVVTLNQGELQKASLGYFVSPPEGTFFTVDETGSSYYYQNGTKHIISAFVFVQRKVKNVAVVLGLEEALDLSDGAPLAPKDGTLIMGDQSATIYAIVSGQKVWLDYNTWVKKYKKAKPSILSQTEVDSYLTQGDQSIQQ